MQGIAAVEALDDRQVRITFDEPRPFPFVSFVGGQTPILQRAQFADCLGPRAPQCTAQNFGPIGTGPFVVCGVHAPLDDRLRGGFRAMAEVCS